MAVPAGPHTGVVRSSETVKGGCLASRWLPGTTRVAPFSGVKSSSIHMALATK